MTKYYDEKNRNPYCFFQPPARKESVEMKLMSKSGVNTLPTPMEKHRVPRLRLVPRGSR